MRFSIKFENYERIHPNFTKVKIYVMYEGINRNNSYISKKSVEDSLETMSLIPIVGEWIERSDSNNDNFGGHGGKIEISDKGIKWIQTTQPYGVVGENFNPRWEEVTDDFTGETKEYLVVDGYLWSGRYPEVEKIVQNGAWQSMEIEPTDAYWASYQDEDGLFKDVFKIEKFTFEALCILGKDEDNEDFNVEPCFEDAQIVAYGWRKDEFKKEFSQMIQEIREIFGEVKSEVESENNDDEDFAIAKEDIGTGSAIDISNSKDSAVGESDGTWGNVDKASLRDKIMMASNYVSVSKEAYLLVDEENLDNAPSSSVKYPHHDIVDNTLVVHVDGLLTAGSMLNQVKSNGDISDSDYNFALDHINKHRNELGLEELEAFEESDEEETENSENEEDQTVDYEIEIENLKNQNTVLKNTIREFEEMVEHYEKINSELQEKVNTFIAQKKTAEIEELRFKFSSELADDEMDDILSKDISIEEMEKELFYKIGTKKAQFKLNTDKTAKIIVQTVKEDGVEEHYGSATKYLKKMEVKK